MFVRSFVCLFVLFEVDSRRESVRGAGVEMSEARSRTAVVELDDVRKAAVMERDVCGYVSLASGTTLCRISPLSSTSSSAFEGQTDASVLNIVRRVFVSAETAALMWWVGWPNGWAD